MKRLLPLIALLLLPVFARAVDRITVTVTLTNAAVDGNTFTLNGNTRTFKDTVATPSTQVATNGTAAVVKTNLLEQIRGYPFTQVQNLDVSATSFKLIGNSGLAMSASISGTFGYVTYSTQAVTSLVGVRVPIAGEPNVGVQVNNASLLAKGINDLSTNVFYENAAVVGNLVGLTNTQTVAGAKAFTNASGNWAGGITNTPGVVGNLGAVSNGIWWNGVLRAPTLTNGINYGNAFKSPGSATASEQYGNNAAATGISSLAVGASSLASGEASVAIGQDSEASDLEAVAVGQGSLASEPGSIAIGVSASADQTNSIAIGASADTDSANQIMLGTSAYHVTIPGGLYVAGSITNPAAIGTNSLDGHIKFIRKANSALSTGNNAAVDISTNSFVEVSGPGAAFTINGIANGTDGRFLILLNQTGYNMTVAHDSGVDPTAGNRIYTMTGADRATTANGAAILIYSAAASRWILLHLDP